MKDGKSFRFHKKDFEENYNALFADNADFMKQYPYESVDWDQFSFQVFQYTKMSES